VLAGLVLRVTFAPEVLLAAHAGTPHLVAFRPPEGAPWPALLYSILSGVGMEVFFTALLAFAFLAALADRRGPGVGGQTVVLMHGKESREVLTAPSPATGGLIVGLAQAAVVLFGLRLTGGAANPARWFGTVVWEMTLTAAQGQPYAPLGDHTVYWVGPIAGALLGGVLYLLVIKPPED
jgi:glycerol uptake facilitator-like aquaporin